MPTETKLARKKPIAKTATAAGRKIVLLGYAEESRDLIYGYDSTWELWGINMAHAFTFQNKGGKWTPDPRLKVKQTAWFQIHPKDWSTLGQPPTGNFGRPPEHIDFLREFPGDVWMMNQGLVDEFQVKNGKAYPYDSIIEHAERRYMTSTFAIQLALAWYQHRNGNPIEQLDLVGVNLTSLDEYTHQKPCVEYWIGRLEGEGVKVTVPSASALLKGGIYALDRGNDLSEHAFDRLQHYKQNYLNERDNIMIASSFQVDAVFWVNKINMLVNAIIKKYPDIKLEEDTELREMTEGWVEARRQFTEGFYNQGMSGALKAAGMIQEQQHWLTLTGGIDHRGNAIPEIRTASMKLSNDVSIPEAKTI